MDRQEFNISVDNLQKLINAEKVVKVDSIGNDYDIESGLVSLFDKPHAYFKVKPSTYKNIETVSIITELGLNFYVDMTFIDMVIFLAKN